MSERGNTKSGGSKSGSWLMTPVRMVAYVMLIMIISTGANFFHKNTKFLQNTKTVDLNEVLREGKAFPEGEFVSLKIYYPLGAYAENTSQLTIGYSGSGDGFQTGKDYYYAIFMEDYTIMSVMVANEDDMAALDRLIQSNNENPDLEDYSDLTDYVELTGNLTLLRNSQITDYYKELVTMYGFDSDSEMVRMYVLDATAVPGSNILLIVGVIAGIIILIEILHKLKQRKKKEAAAAELQARQRAEEQARQEAEARERQRAEEQARQQKKYAENMFSDTGFSSSFDKRDKWNDWMNPGDL